MGPYLQVIFASTLITFGLLLTLPQDADAQLKRFPLPEAAPMGTVAKTAPSSARTQADPRKLPFFDDFSATPTGVTSRGTGYPVDSLWINNKTIWINDGLALHAPSYNVAVFDGLDSAFLPYSSELLLNGFRDSLVSQPIDLSESEVTAAERPTVYFSFFYQWQGNGEAPDPTDYLMVEFKNSSGKWIPVVTILPRPSFERTVFYDTIVQVPGAEYFHSTFQFRFRNYGRTSGPYDTWNVDYVYLNKYRNPDDRDFPDQAVSSSLSSLFEKYRSIPYDHFLSSGVVTRPSFGVSNNLDEYTDLTYLTEATFVNYRDNVGHTTFISNLGVNDTSAINDDGSGIIFPLEKRIVHLEYIPDATSPSQFDPESDSVWLKLKVRLFTGDTFDPKTGAFAHDYNLNYRPIDFRVNDTISAEYKLRDYYAYDDGAAEYAAGLTQAGNRAAVAFDMLIADPDTLVAIDVYAPDYALSSNLTVDFTIYADNDGLPGGVLYTIPSVTIQRKGIDRFQRIRIVEPFLVDGRFHVGWKAPVGGSFQIGLDYDNDSGDKIFVNTNGTWSPSTDITGSLMIRPVFGNGDVVTSAELLPVAGIYPNPNDGTFYIDAAFDALDISTATGRSVNFHLIDEGERRRVILLQPATGLYLLRIRTGNTYQSGKIIVK